MNKNLVFINFLLEKIKWANEHRNSGIDFAEIALKHRK